MALNPIPIGDRIAEYLYENPLGAAGTEISLGNIKLIWENIMTLIYNDIKANMDVLPASLGATPLQNDAGQPVHVDLSTGDGTTIAPQTIIGTGSVE